MKIHRTLPPAAAPIRWPQLWHGLSGLMFGERYLRGLERELKNFFEVRHVFLVSSGKAALTLALSALKNLFPWKREVIIPAYTCFSVPSAILKAGLEISLCDVDSNTFDFDYPSLERMIKETTLCVIPSHLFGIPADLEQIGRLCKDRNVFIVEDAAQAMGGMYRGRKLGTFGDAGIFSLNRGKNITCGSGGIIVTNSDRLSGEIDKLYTPLKKADRAANWKEFFKVIALFFFLRPSLYWFPSSLSFLRLGETIFPKEFPVKRLSGMQAGLLKGWQNQLEKLNSTRKKNTAFFIRELNLPVSVDSAAPLLRLPYLFPAKEAQERVYRLSRKQGLGLSPMYPCPIHEIREIRNQFNGQTFPVARYIATSLLTIPTHSFLCRKDKEEICRLMRDGIRGDS